MNRLFVLSLEDNTFRARPAKCFLPKLQIKDYNVMIDGRSFFDQPVRKNVIIYENIRKNTSSQGDDYTTACLLDHSYFKENYKLIAIDLSKYQVLHSSTIEIQPINFCWILGLDWKYNYVFHSLGSKINYSRIFLWNSKNIVNLFCKFIFVLI